MTNEPRPSYPTGQPDAAAPMSSTGTTATEMSGTRTEQPRQRVAGSLDRAASTIRERASQMPGGDRVAGVARSAADRLQTAASYVRDHDVQAMADDARQVVRRNPTGSLLAACAAGFVVGFMMRRR